MSGPPNTAAARLWAGLATLLAPLLRLHLRSRAMRGREVAARLAEREGKGAAARPPGALIWLHAASVGETLSVLPVVAALPENVFTLFTTGTRTSAQLLDARLRELGLSHRVTHRFVPLDVPAWCEAFLTQWRPDLACFVESELWPNMLASCRRRGIPAVLLNARLSVRSAARWCHLPGFARQVLGGFAWIAAQSEADARRLRSLGAAAVDAPGNLKFAAPALPCDAGELARLAARLGDAPRWVMASTHPGDEARAAAVHAALAPDFPGLITAIVPRHPERGAAIAAGLGGAGRRALGDDPAAGIWVADTLGELGLWYRLFPVVVMGKSFPPGGGQNPLEPARLGCAVACGPAMQNFTDAVETLRAAGGLAELQDEAASALWVGRMLRDDAARAAMARAARQAAAGQDGLPAALAARLVAAL